MLRLEIFLVHDANRIATSVNLSIPMQDSQFYFIKERERFDLLLDLHVPESSNNMESGNFMVDFKLISKNVKVSKRPGMLLYKSMLLKTFETFYKIIWLLPGLSTESQFVRVKLMENLYQFKVYYGQPSGRSILCCRNTDKQAKS